jgi:putative ABC transport system ATP-binding protein
MHIRFFVAEPLNGRFWYNRPAVRGQVGAISSSLPDLKRSLTIYQQAKGADDMSFMEISNVKKSYGEGEAKATVLKGIDLKVEKGEFCVLLGHSGSGKSTLLNIIGGIDDADDGIVKIDGEKTADMNERRLTKYRRSHLGYVFQMYNLIPNLTVRENIEGGAYLSDKPFDTDEILRKLGLYEHQNKLPKQLSGGQQQRTAIGRAVIKNPDILLCDEPTGALDYNTSKEILALLEKIHHEYHNTIIMVTHNDALKAMADRVVKLRDGRIVADYHNEKPVPVAELEW